MTGDACVMIAMRTFDRPLLLRRAIEDVRAQSFTDWRLSILNNGGDPDSVHATIAAAGAASDKRVSVIDSRQRLRPGAAINAALIGRPGRFVAIHDDDDTWDPAFLERTVRHMERADDDVAAVAVRLNAINETIAETTIETVGTEEFTPHLERINFQSVLIRNPFPPIGMLVRRDVFDEVGGYDESLRSAVDWMFLLRILERRRVEIIRAVLANYHLRPDASGSDANIVSDRAQMRVSDSQVIAHYADKAVRDGDLELTALSLAMSEVDRINHARIREFLDHVRVLHLLSGDIEFRSRQIRDLLSQHDETFQAVRSVLRPFAAAAAATQRFRKRSANPC